MRARRTTSLLTVITLLISFSIAFASFAGAGPDSFKWRLEDIYPGAEQWEQDFRQVQNLSDAVEAYRGRLGESAGTLLGALQARDRLLELNDRVYSYAAMRLDEDNTNPASQALKDRAASLSTRVEAACSFIPSEILALTPGVVDEFQRKEPGLAHYRFDLERILRFEANILCTAEEEILARAGEVLSAQDRIYRMMNDADMTFPAIKDERGNKVKVTHGSYGLYRQSGDRRVRHDAFTSFYSSYSKLENTFAAALSSSVKRDIFYAREHKYPSSLQAALFEDNVPPEVYENLIKTVRRNTGLLHRYVSLRKKLLGLDELHAYDLYAPVVKDPGWKISYPQAAEMVKSGLSPLGRTYVETLGNGLQSGWVDVCERKGKTSGAYSTGPYGSHPFVLLNYQDSLENVFTLAHEMGHAMHSFYSNGKQPYVYSQYSIFTAETASAVNEFLLMEHLLKTETDRDRKLYLHNYYLEQFRATVFRQTMLAEFEKIIHEKAEAGEALTPELLKKIYRQLNVDYYGPDLVVDPEVDMEWARIPHFYRPFYVYKYATGFAAAAGLSRQILNNGEPEASSYLDLLGKGGSDYPLNLLREAGVDMSKPEPIQDALDLFSRLLDEMERI
ncbi:MAG: oligoendopeptidase F [Eubacteriales bacterium]